LAELDKRQEQTDANDANDVPDTDDVNDVNDIIDVLSVISQASEFAGEEQRRELLSDPFVKQSIQRAIDKAADLEVRGQWLDAYINCYSWLKAIDPENKAYADYADQLLDKATIVASFQDSPCETREQRYKGIRKEMFIWAVEVLNVHYVRAIDYSQMANKAIERCQLLAEVMGTSFAKNLPEESPEKSFSPPDANQLATWSVGLAALADEVEQSPTGLNKNRFLDVFEKVLTINTSTAELPEPALVAQFAEAALSALDPYTLMVWPSQAADFKKTMTNEFTGIGVEISKPKGLLTVSSLLPGTPAYNAGLDAGDVIAAVNGLQTKDMTLICAVRKITGPAGTDVKLTIKRPGQEKTREVTITRAKITVPSIRGWKRTETGGWLYMIDEPNKIGYVRLTGFTGETASDLEKALRDLEADGMKGLILDLRFNSGGLLPSAIQVADKFIRKGPIVTTLRLGREVTLGKAQARGTHPDYPLVILINGSSASASEIVAGALGDTKYHRAILVGERTHGKGLVQSIMDYPGGTAQLKYTMAHYYLPSGQRVRSREEVEKEGGKDWGIGPDIEMDLRSDELRTMLKVQRENDVLVQADHDPNSASVSKHTAEETLKADPQLAIGLLIIRSKLIESEALVSEAKRDSHLQVAGLDRYGRYRPI
jgi:carboxyl-terminal processing protease